MTSLQVVLLALAFVAVAVSVVTDLATRKIKDFVTYPAIAAGLALHALGGGWDGGDGLGLKSSLLGLIVAGLPFFAMNAIDSRSFGMGDVKLMAAVGALLGWPAAFEVVIYVALLGGVFGLAVLLAKGRLTQTLAGMVRRRRPARDAPDDGDGDGPTKVYIPYGLAIAGGTVLVIALEISRRGIL